VCCEPSIRRPRWSIAVALIMSLTAVGAAATPGSLLPDWPSRVSPRVLSILKSAQAPSPKPSQSPNVDSIAPGRQVTSSVRYDAKGRLQVDVAFDCGRPAPRATIIAAGMVIGTIVNVPPMCLVEGWVAVGGIPTVASIVGVRRIDLPRYSKPHPPISLRSAAPARANGEALATNGLPAIDGNGIAIMNVDKYIQQTAVTGAGITIGVISDDATSLSLIQGRGELPMSAKVIQPSANPMTHSSLTDEGTMMLEEVFAVAPGATLLFCGPETATEYLGCVQNLIAAGATVISDDVSYTGFDVMSASTENDAAQAVESLLTGDPQVMLYHSAGNDAQDYWQGAYNPLPGSATCSNSGQTPQNDSYLQQFGTSTSFVTWQTNGNEPLFLASVIPAGATVANNFDVYVYDPVSAQIVACATSATGGTAGSTSYTSVDGSTIPNGSYEIYIGTQDTSLSGTFLKLIGVGDGADTFSPVTSGAPTSPQDFAAGVIMVGAVNGGDGIGNTIEAYSDTGPIQLEVPSASTLQAPHVVAPDAIYVDNSGTHFTASGGIFAGTSAASPNAAAVAVLLRSAFPALTAAQITTSMETGAAPLGNFSPNNTFGYGRVDALGALAALPAPTITPITNQSVVGGKSSAKLAFTLGGTGALTVKANSDNTALVSANSQEIVVSPSTCGTTATSCTVMVSPTLGQVGTAHITLYVTDGAQRSASAPFTVTVSKPAPPTVSVMTGATQTITEGGAIIPVTFTVAGTQTLAVAVSSSNSTLLPGSMVTVTSGCGSKISTCTAILTVTPSQAGTSKLTITATDPYSQSGSATATVTVNAPPSKGGGGLDLWTLLPLGCLVLLQVSASTRRRNESQ
jgi:hypothetical protein